MPRSEGGGPYFLLSCRLVGDGSDEEDHSIDEEEHIFY